MAGGRASPDTHITSHRSIAVAARPARCEEETRHDTYRCDRAGGLDRDGWRGHGAGAQGSARRTRRPGAQSQYGDGGPARGAPWHRQGDGGSDRRVPAKEWRLQEGRGSDERARHRREELPQAEAAHHRRTGQERARCRTVVAPPLRGRHARPRSGSRFASSAGYTLIELLVVAGLLTAMVATAIPLLTAGLERARARAAARYL